ncbi:MAG: hypothetical protein ABI835_14485, partial [Chloroflexota bacterium]
KRCAEGKTWTNEQQMTGSANPRVRERMKALLGKVSTTWAKTAVRVRNSSDVGSPSAKVGDADRASVGS